MHLEFNINSYFEIKVFYARSVVSIGSYAFAYCTSLKAVVILPTAISIGSNAFYEDIVLTRIDATEGICAQVLNSCSGTCYQFKQCSHSPSPPRSPGGLSAEIIAVIVISVITGVVLLVLLLWREHRSRTQSIQYGAVGAVEMQSIPEQRMEDSTTEARVLPQGELLMSLDHASTYPAAAAVVVRTAEQAVVVSSHEIVTTLTTSTTTVSEEVV
jgi:hypothetical protein